MLPFFDWLSGFRPRFLGELESRTGSDELILCARSTAESEWAL